MISDKLGFRNVLLTISGIFLALIVFFISQIENLSYDSNLIYGLVIVFPVLYGIFGSLYYSSLSLINTKDCSKMAFSLSIVFENIGLIFLLGLTNFISQQKYEFFNVVAYNECL